MRRRSSWLQVGLTALFLIVSMPATARAEDVSTEEFHRLIAQAAEDADAIPELEQVTSVEGRPVDLDVLLDGDTAEVSSRLDALDADLSVRAPDPDAARTAAQSILAAERFEEPSHPRPLAGLLERITGLLRGPWEALMDRFNALTGWGKAAVISVAAAILLSVGWALARLIAKRRPLPSDIKLPQTAALLVQSPEQLERAADAAEKEREYGLAVRLRFRAGLIRLADKGVIEFRPSDTSLSLRRKVGSPVFDRLADRFDAIVYGRQPATPEDAEDARSKWRSLQREARA